MRTRREDRVENQSSRPLSVEGTSQDIRLSVVARQYMRQRALRAIDEIPAWAYRDLLWALDTCESLHREVEQLRSQLDGAIDSLGDYAAQRYYAERLSAEAGAKLESLVRDLTTARRRRHSTGK